MPDKQEERMPRPRKPTYQTLMYGAVTHLDMALRAFEAQVHAFDLDDINLVMRLSEDAMTHAQAVSGDRFAPKVYTRFISDAHERSARRFRQWQEGIASEHARQDRHRPHQA